MRNCVRGGKGGVSSASFLSWYWLFLRRHEDAQRHKTCDKVRTQTPSPQSQAEVQYLDPNSLFCNMSIIGGALKKNGWMTCYWNQTNQSYWHIFKLNIWSWRGFYGQLIQRLKVSGTQLRKGIFPLNPQEGTFKNSQEDNSLCELCELGNVDNESHFLLYHDEFRVNALSEMFNIQKHFVARTIPERRDGCLTLMTLKSGTNVRTVSVFVLSSGHNVLRLGKLFVHDTIMIVSINQKF